MNICFLLGGFSGVGGIGRVTSILANELVRDDKYNIHTISYFNNKSPNLYNLNNNIHNNFLFDNPISMTKGMLKGGILKLRRFLKENKIDVLIACGVLYYPLATISSKGLNVKTICWEHSNVQNSKDHSFQLLSRRLGAKMADQVVTLTKHDKNSYIEKYNIDNVMHVYNPIDETLFKQKLRYNEKSKKIISVGRLSYQKNFESLIQVAKEVFRQNPSWSWDIYGEGELYSNLKQLIIDSQLENHVFLKGRTNQLYQLYNEYSFLVMTSRYEGFPMTLLEGMANGLPLISYDILTGPNEIIKNNINGYLIEPFNNNLMAERINYLITNANKRIQMSESNLDMREQYKLEEISSKWKQLFNKL